MAVLSISIPTYNRASQLEELVKSILSLQTDEIEVVVTCNGCTDNTLEKLGGINDKRLKVCNNEKAVPGYYNMILGLFNASGKYVMHCNDRDILCVERIPSFINFLKDQDFSYISTSRWYQNPTFKIDVFEKGYESILNQTHSRHPTGMVFNRELMKNLHKEDYLKYVDDTFTYSFLMRELLVYEKSAVYDNRIWNERHSSIKLQLASGSIYKGGLYFEPERIVVFMRSVIKHLIGNKYFNLTSEQEITLILNIIVYFKKQLIYKKVCFADNRECAHYGMKVKFISFFEMKKIYEYYIQECDKVICNSKHASAIKPFWNKTKRSFIEGLLKDCLRADYSIIVKKYKRLTDSKYPY